MHSLRVRLFGLWALSLAASVAIGLLLVQLYRQSTDAQVARAEAVVARACDLVPDRYGFCAAGWSGPGPPTADPTVRASLAAVLGPARRGVRWPLYRPRGDMNGALRDDGTQVHAPPD